MFLTNLSKGDSMRVAQNPSNTSHKHVFPVYSVAVDLKLIELKFPL